MLFGESVTKKLPIAMGLPQGSSFSPFLFILFHADLVNYVDAYAVVLGE